MLFKLRIWRRRSCRRTSGRRHHRRAGGARAAGGDAVRGQAAGVCRRSLLGCRAGARRDCAGARGPGAEARRAVARGGARRELGGPIASRPAADSRRPLRRARQPRPAGALRCGATPSRSRPARRSAPATTPPPRYASRPSTGWRGAPSFKRVLDLGCGTGVLAIAAARTFPGARVLAVDNDPVATAVARANARLNRVAGRVRVLDAVGFDHALVRRAQPFDLVLANILPSPLIALAPGHAPRPARRAASPCCRACSTIRRARCAPRMPRLASAPAPTLPRWLDCADACAAVIARACPRIQRSRMRRRRGWPLRRGGAPCGVLLWRRHDVGYLGASNDATRSTRLARSIYQGRARALPQDRQRLHRSRDRAPLRALGEGRPGQPRGVAQGGRGRACC